MYSLKYRLTTRAPVIISVISGDRNMVRTEQYIPGTSVLGLLAERFIKTQSTGKEAHKNLDFYNWFLAGGVKIGNAYILSQDEYGEYRNIPTPFSIETEKYGTAVYDCLFTDTDDTKYIGDFCYLEEGSIQVKTVETRIEFHHARNREKGIAEKGMIFNYESIAAEQVFEGEIFGEKYDLEKILACCGNKWTAFLGRSRNAQYGAIEFKFVNEGPLPFEEQIKLPEDSAEKLKTLISMMLLSDLVLYNEFGFPATDVEDLEKELQNMLSDVRVKKSFVKRGENENFVSIWRLKKPSESCIKAGSVFLLEIESEKANELAAVQQNGLGERTHEGFGRCVFGLQTGAQPDLIDVDTNQVTKPGQPIPAMTGRIIKNIIRQIMQEGIKLYAVNKQAEFVRLPSNSLIAKLHALAEKSDGNREAFAENINRLQKLAANRIRHCVSRDHNLLEYLLAFKLDENAIANIERKGFDRNKIESIKKIAVNKEFVLLENLREFVKLGKEEKFNDSEVRTVLGHVNFLHDPVGWFFNQPMDKGLKELSQEIDYRPEADSELKQDLIAAFYATFFSVMRKRKIAEEKHGAV